MITVGLIFVASCTALIMLICIKPTVSFAHHEVSIYWAAPLMGAVSVIAVGGLSVSDALSGITANTAVNPLKILILFISMTLLSVYLDCAGFFQYMASCVLSTAKSDQKKLFSLLYVTVSVLTVFTSNDIIILTFTPFICYFLKNAKVDPLPYLIGEFVAANTWSMMLVIGNPTNIYLTASAGMDFLQYTAKMILPTIAAGAVSYLMLRLIFRKELSRSACGSGEPVRLRDRGAVIIGILHLSVCILLMVISSYIHIEMWAASLSCLVSLCILSTVYSLCKRQAPVAIGQMLYRAPWEIIPFVLSMFVLVLSLKDVGITDRICSFLAKLPAVPGYGTASLLCANITNNIPMSVLFSAVIEPLAPGVRESAMLAVVIGSNIGAFLTPIGALAGIMWCSILRSKQIEFSFLKFMKYGFAIALPSAAAALSMLALVC